MLIFLRCLRPLEPQLLLCFRASTFRSWPARRWRVSTSSIENEPNSSRSNGTGWSTIGGRSARAPTILEFEKMIEVFETGYRKFVSTIDQENLGPVVPNQCEVSYINQIAVSAGQTFWSLFASTFPNCSAGATVADLGHPEDMTFAMRYVIPAAGGGPLGRVTVAAQPAKRADGTNIIQFTLTARGKPATADIPGVLEFLTNGRVLLNRTFESLTSAEIQKQWGRKQ